MISQAEMDFWIEHNYNVLFEGEAGVGKTSVIIQAWNRHNLKYMYLSGSTLDPWVDFVGVPKEIITEDGKRHLDLVRPIRWENDDVEALFIDEYNRAPKKVRNAVMELIQFKSINGKKFNNLRFVWVAINPDDSESAEYDVEPLDPAQKDRFHCHVEIPFMPSLEYFSEKFDPNTAEIAIAWWQAIPQKTRHLVSPRRLDYALEIFLAGGDLKYVLPQASNIGALTQKLELTPIKITLSNFIETSGSNRKKAIEQATTWIAIENNYVAALPMILGSARYQTFFVPLMPEEKIASLLHENVTVLTLCGNLYNKYDKIRHIVDQIIENGENQSIVDSLQKAVDKIKHKQQENDKKLSEVLKKSNQWAAFSLCNAENKSYKSDISSIHSKVHSARTVSERLNAMESMKNRIPENMDLPEVRFSLEVIEYYIGKSRRGTLRNVEYLVPMANHLFELAERYGMTIDELSQLLPNTFEYMLHREGFFYVTK